MIFDSDDYKLIATIKLVEAECCPEHGVINLPEIELVLNGISTGDALSALQSAMRKIAQEGGVDLADLAIRRLEAMSGIARPQFDLNGPPVGL